MIKPSTVQDLIQGATSAFSAESIDTARLDAEILLSHVLGCARMALYGRMADALSDHQCSSFQMLVGRRLNLEPVAYITGEQEFWSLPFRVTPNTLIPRPDTETLVETVLGKVSKGDVRHVLDLGTGSGCILLSLLTELNGATGVGADISAGALSVAEENADRLGLRSRVRLVESDWFQNVRHVQGGFQVIVSNPPYIPKADISGLMPDVREYEPVGALDGGPDGLSPYRVLAKEAPEFLAAGGLLAVEVGIHQAADVAALFKASGLVDVSVTKDLGGIERVVAGKKPE